ncbi:MFS transporter [Caulobacter sp. NIBR2454]|uniref:MFS transporter n=1 Tax=Caulobacter sp. NIBR2454 TaxID=3015996 RepID=UPI0022B65805|nr:MFS transporter [Caulobacter sp. NIBR2454]
MANQQIPSARARGSLLLKILVFLMFAMFAMTTDAVGTVIPEVIREFGLGLTAAGSFQYATMSGIGIAAIGLGFLADRLGRKATILIGLGLFGVASALFAAGHDFLFFTGLLFISGLGIGVFKSGALALIGDLSRSTGEHARTMNLVEGFFGVGAIVGPALVAYLVQSGASWKWVYLLAAGLCALLLIGSFAARFPRPVATAQGPVRPDEALRLMRDPASLFFGLALMLYVGAEAAVYVWAPTYLSSYQGPWVWLVAYAVAIFFVLRAIGRFLGVWLLSKFDWTVVVAICSSAMAALFWVAVAGGRDVALFALPATGLFMSVLYPTLNSAGISCHDKSRHGSIAGLLLFFTCVGAVVAPLLMGLAGDWLGEIAWSITAGAALASLLAALCVWNAVRKPFAARLAERDVNDYSPVETKPAG